ncbi:hypothetical protein HUX88_00475 [Duganella sp. BJB1802]|nr:hypothetical protein [Duganella sp. BJB1802]
MTMPWWASLFIVAPLGMAWYGVLLATKRARLERDGVAAEATVTRLYQTDDGWRVDFSYTPAGATKAIKCSDDIVFYHPDPGPAVGSRVKILYLAARPRAACLTIPWAPA